MSLAESMAFAAVGTTAIAFFWLWLVTLSVMRGWRRRALVAEAEWRRARAEAEYWRAET